MPKTGDRKPIVRIVLIYATFASAWILVSDQVVSETYNASLIEQLAHSSKGLIFVALTAVLLYALMLRFINDRNSQNLEFAAITEQARECILICDAQLRVLYANPALQEISGYSLDETKGKLVSQYLPPQLAPKLAIHVELLRSTQFLREDWQIQHKDGHSIALELLTQRLPDGRFLAMGTDVSLIRSAQRTAEMERQRLAALLHAIPDPVWLKDTDGRYIACNPAVEHAMNLPADQIIGNDDETIHHRSDSNDFRTTDQHVITSGKQTTFEQLFPLPDGSLAYFKTTKNPVFSAQGEIWGVVGIARDVTLERKAIANLTGSELRFRTLFESASDILLVSDESGHLINVNKRACSTYGYSREELLGLSIFDINPCMTRAQYRQSWATLCQDNQISIRTSNRHKDGHLIPVDFRISALAIDGETVALAQIRNVTELENAEMQIRKTEILNAAIIDAVPSQMAVTDHAGNIIQVNQAWRLFAHENCRKCERSFCIINPYVGDNFFEVSEQSDYAENAQSDAAKEGLRAVLDMEIPSFVMESTCRTPDKERWFILTVSSLHKGMEGALLSYTDITQIKQAQLLEEKLRCQLQALAHRHLKIQENERHWLSMELHDQVSQSLAVLKISLYNLQESEPSHSDIAESIASATMAVDDIANTIHSIARRLRPPLLDMLGLTSAVRWHIENLPQLSNTQLVFDNQIGNCRFSPELELSAFRFIQEAITNAVRHAQAKQILIRIMVEESHLSLEVSDDGIGFDVEYHEHTNELTSLGLLGIRERINQQNGSVSIKSQTNAGTRLIAQIPIDTNLHEPH